MPNTISLEELVEIGFIWSSTCRNEQSDYLSFLADAASHWRDSIVSEEAAYNLFWVLLEREVFYWIEYADELEIPEDEIARARKETAEVLNNNV